MKALFITAGGIEWASARIRAYWPAKYMDADVLSVAEIRKHGLNVEGYGAVIWQKAFDPNIMQTLKDKDIKQYADICDPLYWYNPKDFARLSSFVDGVVCSTEALADDLQDVTGYKQTHVIPDRLELSHYPIKHKHHEADPVRMIWYGIYANRVALHSATPTLERLACNGYNIELTILDDRPDIEVSISDKYPVYHVRWELDKENAIIAAHDIALVPPYPGEWGRLKSNNRTLTAWACGLPAEPCDSYQFIEECISTIGVREIRALYGKQTLDNYYDVRQSAAEWEALLCAG